MSRGGTILLVHGLGLDGSAYTALAEGLDRYRLLVPDLRGHGTASARRPVTLSGMASDVVAAIDEIGSTVHLVGHSMGGAVATMVAGLAPEVVSSLTIVASPPEGVLAFLERAEAAERDGVSAQVQPTLDRWFDHSTESSVVAAARTRLERMRQDAWTGAWRSFSAFPGVDRVGVPSEISGRTLCLSSPDDRSTPPAVVAETSARLPGSRHVTVPAGGHLAILEHPAVHAALLRTHVQQVDAQIERTLR